MMSKKYLIVAVSLCGLLFSLPVFSRAQTAKEDKDTLKFRRKVTELNDQPKASIYLKLKDGTKLHGHLSNITFDHFDITDKKSNTTTTVEYGQIKNFHREDLTLMQKLALAGTVPILIMAVYVAFNPQ